MIPRHSTRLLLRSSLVKATPSRCLSSTSKLLQNDKPKHELVENEKEYQFQAPLKRDSEYTMNKRMEMIERLKAVILGILALGGVMGGYELYQNKAKIKYYLFNEYDLSGFDESYDKINKLKKLKFQEPFKPANPNSSDVLGLYIVGNNLNKQLVNDNKKIITNFMRNSWFDDKILKDVEIGQFSSCAIDSKGDLIQWGNGFKENHDPEITLKGHNLVKLELSNGVVYCLNKKGELIYLPESSASQSSFQTSRLFGLRHANYKKIDNLKFKQIKCGKEHLILLSKDKKVYIMATGLNPLAKSQGQFGLPVYSQYDQPPLPNEIMELTNLNYYTDASTSALKQRNFSAIASGDYHNLALDEFGNVWSWGVNTFGSLGHTISYNTEIIPTPKKIEINKSYFKRNELPQCKQILAGGMASFGTFKSSNIYNIFEDYIKDHDGDLSKMNLNSGEDNMLHLGWGKCLHGQLGIGHYVHSQSDPIKLRLFGNLSSFNEETQKVEKIGVKDWSVGSKHSIVTLDNNDVLVFGDNEFYQLGNGKRVKSSSPSNIPKIVEPNLDDAKLEEEATFKKNKNLKKYQNINNRLQLNNVEFQTIKGKSVKNVEQKIYAGYESSAIYYTPI